LRSYARKLHFILSTFCIFYAFAVSREESMSTRVNGNNWKLPAVMHFALHCLVTRLRTDRRTESHDCCLHRLQCAKI